MPLEENNRAVPVPQSRKWFAAKVAAIYAVCMMAIFPGGAGLILLCWASPADYGPVGDMLGGMFVQIYLSVIFLPAVLLFNDSYPGLPPVIGGTLGRDFAAKDQRKAAFRRSVKLGVGYFFIMALFSWTWLASTAWLAHAHLALELRKKIPDDISNPRLAVLLLSICLAPFVEEIIFRGAIMQTLILMGSWIRWERFHKLKLGVAFPILITSLIWASLHVGMIEPAWVKYGQVTGLGIILGVARLRLGLAGSIALHLAFNIFGNLLPVPGFMAG